MRVTRETVSLSTTRITEGGTRSGELIQRGVTLRYSGSGFTGEGIAIRVGVFVPSAVRADSVGPIAVGEVK